jgi:predicted RNA-binding protein associated with RNAse of E/G family
LKAEIKELKYGVGEVIDAVEDLAIAKQQEQITTDQAQRAFDRFGGGLRV